MSQQNLERFRAQHLMKALKSGTIRRSRRSEMRMKQEIYGHAERLESLNRASLCLSNRISWYYLGHGNVPTLELTGQTTFEETLRVRGTYVTAY